MLNATQEVGDCSALTTRRSNGLDGSSIGVYTTQGLISQMELVGLMA